MKKLPIWKGNDIGHGSRGGVLTVGSHEVKVGQEVPIDLLSKAAVKSLRDKNAIVDEAPVDEKSALESAEKLLAAEAIKTAKATLKEAKSLVKDGKKSVKDQQKVYDSVPDEPEAAKVEVEEALNALKSELETAEANVEAATQALADLDG